MLQGLPGQGRAGMLRSLRVLTAGGWAGDAPCGRGTSAEPGQGRWEMGSGAQAAHGDQGMWDRATHRYGTCPRRLGMASSHQLHRSHMGMSPHPSLSHHGCCARARATTLPPAPKSLLCQPEPYPQVPGMASSAGAGSVRPWLAHGWHTAGTQPAHPCGCCCIDQPNGELMAGAPLVRGSSSAAAMGKVEPGAPGHCPQGCCKSHFCSLSCGHPAPGRD